MSFIGLAIAQMDYNIFAVNAMLIAIKVVRFKTANETEIIINAVD